MWNWIVGLGVSLAVGQVATAYLLIFLRRYVEQRHQEFRQFSKTRKLRLFVGLDSYPPVDVSEKNVPAWVTGPVERLFFTTVIVYEVSGAAIAMVAWITLKMLSSRKYREERAKSVGIGSALPFEYAGLLGNLSSMFFALVGGLIILKAPF